MRARQSPFAVEMPLLTFDLGQASECGGSPETERDLKPVKFTLDKKNYRIIPLGYRGSLAPRQNRRFPGSLGRVTLAGAEKHLAPLSYFAASKCFRSGGG
jgi:hypothetical protein